MLPLTVPSPSLLRQVHVQNSTLAGGVAVGTAADLMIHPWGAALLGILAAIISVCGYVYITVSVWSSIN